MIVVLLLVLGGQLAEIVSVFGGLREGSGCIIILLCATIVMVMVRVEHDVVLALLIRAFR